MARKYGLCFGIMVVMFSCIIGSNNLAKASCSENKNVIFLINDTYAGIIRYFNWTCQNITVEAYVMATTNYSKVANESRGVTGCILKEFLDPYNMCPIPINAQCAKQIICHINGTGKHFPSSALQSNYTCDTFCSSLNPAEQCHNKTNITHKPPTNGSSTTKMISTTNTPGTESSIQFQYPKENITMNPVSINSDGSVNAEAVVEMLSNLRSMIDRMGNATVAAVSMGEVKGIIQVIPKKRESEDITLALTSADKFARIQADMTGEIQNSFMIPSEAVDTALKETGKPFVGVFRSPLLTEDKNKKKILNSEIFAIEMGTSISNLSRTINITYANISKAHANLTCCSWNGTGQPSWIMDGCYSEEINNTLTCRCTHLTFFAVLMSLPANISSSDVKSLTYITYIGCGMSTFFLSIALFMHVTLRRSKSTKTTKILLNLFVAMFMLNLTFLSNYWLTGLKNDSLCKFIAGAMHYFMLSTFTWFAIEAFHLYLQLIKVFNINIRYYMVKILVVGWVFPLLAPIVIVIVGKYGRLFINTTDNNPVYMCWITDISVNYIVNIGYYAVVFTFTLVLFVMVVRRIVYLRKTNVGLPKQRSVSKDIFTVAGLCGLLGITWGFAFFSHGPLLIPSYYIFTILNSFQGFFLFLYYYNTNNDPGESKKSTLRSTVSNFKSTDISHSTVSKNQ